jgi:hypothetical protein
MQHFSMPLNYGTFFLLADNWCIAHPDPDTALVLEELNIYETSTQQLQNIEYLKHF